MDEFGMSFTVADAGPDWARAEEYVQQFAPLADAGDEDAIEELITKFVPEVEGLDDLDETLRQTSGAELRDDLAKARQILDEALAGTSEVARFRTVAGTRLIDMTPNTNADAFVESVWNTGLLAVAGFSLA